MRRNAALLLLAVAAVWGLVLFVAAVIGGFKLGALSVTSAKPLRFVLLLGFAGWWLLPVKPHIEHPRRWLLGALAFIAAWGALYRVTHWLAFDTAAFDLTLFESTLHYTLEGRFMFAWGLGRSLFSEHFEPIVLCLLPLYALVRHPAALLFAQWAATALAVVPLYLSVRALGLDRRIAALAGAAYFFNPVIWQANRIDFHPELFAPLAVFWALHASLTRRWVSLYLALAFAFLLKEEMALVMLCFAPLVLKGDGPRRWPHALAVGVLSVAWGALTFGWLMPAFHPAGAELHPLAGRWAHLGATYPEMALGFVTHPLYVLGLVFSAPVLELLASLGFVPLLDPASALAALPPLLLHLSGNYEYAARLGAYYGLLGTCLLFVGLVFALARAQKRFGERGALLAGMLAIVCMPTLPFLAPVSAADLHASAFIAGIDPKDAVCAQSPVVPHRRPGDGLKMIPFCDDTEPWLLFAKQHEHWPLNASGEYDAYVKKAVDSGAYSAAFSEGDYLFLHRSTPLP